LQIKEASGENVMTEELANKLNADSYLSKKEAAEYWGYSTKTVERCMKAGLKYYLITGEPRFKKADLNQFAEQFRKDAA
jgi:short subunit dehydrogenase-like uncharacterized protein